MTQPILRSTSDSSSPRLRIAKRAGFVDSPSRIATLNISLGPQTTRQSLLPSKVSDALDASQKRNFITNLLQKMRRAGQIEGHGKGPTSHWELSKPSEKPAD